VSWSEDLPEGQGPTGICIRTQQVEIVEDTESSAVYRPWKERARQFGIRSYISIPFSAGGARGALMVYAKQPKAFGDIAIDAFLHLVEQISSAFCAIENRRQLDAERAHVVKMEVQLAQALSGMVAPIVLAMEMRDPYTAGHQGRVAELAVAIGAELGWHDGQLQGLRVAAQVHDIGKIAIPAEILTKPGKLSAAEWDIIKSHPATAYTILKDIPFPWPIAEIVLQHHEKIDGSGYPRGLKGDAMLPEAKVLAVADILEAMVAHRPYRPGFLLKDVLEEFERDAGTKLDAEVVRICLALFREKHFMLPAWVGH